MTNTPSLDDLQARVSDLLEDMGGIEREDDDDWVWSESLFDDAVAGLAEYARRTVREMHPNCRCTVDSEALREHDMSNDLVTVASVSHPTSLRPNGFTDMKLYIAREWSRETDHD